MTAMTVIQHTELGSSAASITFSSIPQTYTDLLLKISTRGSISGVPFATISFNGSTANLSNRHLRGYSGAASSFSGSDGQVFSYSASNYTSNTFANSEIVIPNYAGSQNKSWSVDSVAENNSSGAYYLEIRAGLWASSSAITSITITANATDNFVSGSSATLFGILKGSAGGVTVS